MRHANIATQQYVGVAKVGMTRTQQARTREPVPEPFQKPASMPERRDGLKTCWRRAMPAYQL